MRLDRKKAIVIGGSTGIGFEAVRLLAEAGATVVITARTQANLEAAARAINGQVITHAFDGRVAAEMAALFAEVGSFDHLVLTMNTGGGVAPFHELHEE